MKVLVNFRNTLCVLVGAIFYITPLLSQPANIKFDQIGLEQGLSQSTVYAITQDAYGFMWFGTQDGLNRYDGYSLKIYKNDPADENTIAGNSVRALYSDNNGNLWIGTMDNGLDKYVIAEDRFYHFQHNEKDINSISENHITSIFEDSNGDIWVGTKNRGLNRLNRDNGKFTRFFSDDNDSLKLFSNEVVDFCEDHNHNLWIATSNGLFSFSLQNKSERFTHYKNIHSDISTISSSTIRTLYIDSKGIIWAGTWGGGLNSFNAKTNTFLRYIYDKKSPNSISGNFITSINEDVHGSLWISTKNDGINIFDHKSRTFTRYSNEDVLTLYKDRSGIMWMGTFARGVKMYDWRRDRFEHYYDDPKNLNDLNCNLVSAILEDSDGELWVGTYGSGLKRYVQTGKNLRKRIAAYKYQPQNESGINNNRVLSLCETRDGKILVGTEGGGINVFDKTSERFSLLNGISFNQISTITKSRNGDLWIGNNLGGMIKINSLTNKRTIFPVDQSNPTALPAGTVLAIYEDKKGLIWVGTLGGGAICYNPESGTFKRYQPLAETNKSVNNSTVISIYEDDAGIIWMGTGGGGLNRFDPTTASFKYFTEQEGLPNNVVYGILPDKSGNLWLSTNKGISQFNPKTLTFRNYDLKDGLQGNEFNQGAYFASQTGELFFGGMNGVSAFFPDSIKDNDYVPPIYLTSFKVFDKAFQLQSPLISTKKIELTYFQNFFSFEFVALNYTSPEKNQYAYKLEGFDKDWHLVTAMQRYASYTNLDPGKYMLRIKGSNNDGVWNEEGISLEIIINPPFWMTWWFRSLGILLFLSFGLIMYQRRITTLKRDKELQQEISSRLIEKQEEERKRIALEIHDSLGPHLIFIKNKAHSNVKKNPDNQTANESFNQISDAAFEVLNTVREISHNLRPPELDQLGLTETFRSILLTARESTTIEINGEVENIDGLIPFELEINLVRILQEALSNVLKHSGASKCEVIVKVQHKRIIFSISDNGKGFESNNALNENKRKLGLGLTGMMERSRMLGGTIKIKSETGQGTRIAILIPVTAPMP